AIRAGSRVRRGRGSSRRGPAAASRLYSRADRDDLRSHAAEGPRDPSRVRVPQLAPTRKTIAVLGAGNLGLAQAGHLAMQGHAVRLYNRSPARLGPLAMGAKLRLRGALRGEVALELASTRLDEVVRGAELIFVDVPGNGHGELAASLASALEPDSRAVIVLH